MIDITSGAVYPEPYFTFSEEFSQGAFLKIFSSPQLLTQHYTICPIH